MGTAITIIVIILVIAVIVALVGLGSYNGFVKSRNLIQESWRQIDVELNRRYELIPNLIETVRAYAAHERNTLEDITRLRSQAQQLSHSEGSLPSQQRADVEAALSGAVRNLIVSVEAYPDLKSNTNFVELQRQLAETEDRIAAGRRFYNANVRVYNTKVESVPSNIIAGMFKFEKATYFEVNDPTVRQAPTVSFGEIAYRGDAPGSRQGQLPQQSSAQGQYSGPQDAMPNTQQYQQPAYPPQQPYQNPQYQNPQYQSPQQNPQYQSPQYQSPQYRIPSTRIPSTRIPSIRTPSIRTRRARRSTSNHRPASRSSRPELTAHRTPDRPKPRRARADTSHRRHDGGDDLLPAREFRPDGVHGRPRLQQLRRPDGRRGLCPRWCPRRSTPASPCSTRPTCTATPAARRRCWAARSAAAARRW